MISSQNVGKLSTRIRDFFRNLWKVLKSKESRIYFRIDICEDRKPQGAFQNCCIGLVLVYHKVVVTCHWYDIFICYCHIIECWLNWLLLTTLTRMICLQYKWNRTNVYVIYFILYILYNKEFLRNFYTFTRASCMVISNV